LRHPDDRVVAAIEHVKVRAAAERGIARKVPRGYFARGGREIDGQM
jgi:hypothetical protein